MAQTLDNGVIVPVNADAYNLCPDLQTMGNAVKGVTPVANQAARDALSTFVGRTVWRIDLIQFEVYDGSSWLVFDAFEQSSTISTFGTGWSAVTSNAHTPRIIRTGSLVFLMGAVASSSSALLSNILTVPTAFRPPTVSTRFIGNTISSNGSTGSLAITSGVVSIPSGYGNINATTVQTVPLHCVWSMD